MKAWEEILEKNEKSTGVRNLSVYKLTLKDYYLSMANFLTMKSALSYLLFKYDKGMVDLLKRNGILIDTTDSERYQESLIAAAHRINALSSQIITKKNNIEKKFNNDSEQTDFYTMLAWLSMNVGFSVNEKIKLAEFNSYLRQLKLRNHEQNK
jgi:hypothetical protein